MYLRFITFYLLLCCCSCQPDLRQDSRVNWLPQLHIDVQSEYMVLLKRKRHEALREGLLISSPKDFVPAILKYQDKAMPAEIRLKGDWLDHLRGSKWSFRIKLGERHSLMGMRRFSIQHPRTRSFLEEWVFHQLLNQEGILNPRYTFVQIILNGQYKGIYALEEHFDKLLLEKQGRREAPIMKFTEEGFWQLQEYEKRTNKDLVPYLPDFEASKVEAFQKGRTLNNLQLREQYLAASQLMRHYQRAGLKASQLLNIEQLAQYFALTDIAQAWHALRWHNLRFYFNPITGLLEPIGFDAYGDEGPYRWFSKPFTGFYNERYSKVYFAEEYLIFYPFNEAPFRQRYLDYLHQYSRPTFIHQFQQKISTRLDSLEQALKTEYSYYDYKKDFLPKNAEELRQHLAEYSTEHPPFQYTIFEPLYDSCRTMTPFSEIALNAWRASSESIQLANYFCQPISLQASGPKKSKPIHVLPRPQEIAPFDIHQLPDSSLQLQIPQTDRYLFYTVPGFEHWYRKRISEWPTATPISFTDGQRLQLDSLRFKKQGGVWQIPAGQHQIDEIMVIPAGDSLHIAAGAQLDLVEEAGLLILGKVWIQGTSEQPIRLYSSDGSSRGCHFLNVQDTLLLENVHFEQLGNWQGPDRWLSGSVCFYESKVVMRHCRFQDIPVEDALNIVRSDAELQQLYFSGCASDALDLDFSRAQISQCHFENIRGDAIDCSGSRVDMDQIVIRAIGDKGFSLGEQSEVRIRNSKVQAGRIGLAVKDATKAQVQQLHIDNCTYGLMIFNKKAEFGPAQLQANELAFSFVVDSLFLEKNHRFILNGQEQVPTHAPGQIATFVYAQEE
ncbi:MAG: CotH kinase family protein [Bacteroidota bacterium]